jgi:hypothetical protein
MYSPETKAEIERIRSLLPTIPNDDAHQPERIALMRSAVALMREGRMAAAQSSANSKARKAKVSVVDGDSLLADLEASLEKGPE